MIRVAKINLYVELMKLKGITSKQLLAHTDIEPKLLTNPDGFVTREMYYSLIMNIIKLSGNPGIAFSLKDIVKFSDFGILGYAMLSSTTFGQVIRIRRQYHSSMFGAMVNISSVQGIKNGYELTLSSTAPTEILRRFETEEFLVEGLKFIKILTGVTPEIRRLSFSYSKPTYLALYKSFFKCPLEFNAPQTRFNVRAPSFDTPILGGNPELHEVCAKHCREVMQAHPDSSHLRSRLRELFLANPRFLPDLPSAGKSLGISKRHLHRKLEEEGLSFQGLKDEFRLDLSRQLLTSGKLATKEVSYLLGYASPSAFCRAFKLWTGKTVLQYLRVQN